MSGCCSLFSAEFSVSTLRTVCCCLSQKSITVYWGVAISSYLATFTQSFSTVEMATEFYSMGGTTHRVPLSLHSDNRQKLVERLRSRHGASLPEGAFVLLEGGKGQNRYSSDTEVIFRQESYFFWAFGVLEPEFFGAICVQTGRSILFAPQLSEAYLVWLGKIHPASHFKYRYGVDEVYFYEEGSNGIAKVLADHKASTILLLHGQNTDSKNHTKSADFPGIEAFEINTQILHPEITECRVIKTDAELDCLRFASKISSDAHIELMRRVRPGWYEYQAEAAFLHYVYSAGGMRNVAYTCIGASGENGATLHYGHAGAPNDKVIKDGEMVLFDMGGEYFCYSSDITCTWPVNGKFTSDQRLVYEAVYNANRSVMAAARPGVCWLDMHKLAEKTILRHLAAGGVIRSKHAQASVTDEELDEMVTARLGAVFMPHGLGHFFGLDVHDVGGYALGNGRLPEPGLSSLRTLRLLEANMTITIEPGCYFIDPVLDKALLNPIQGQWLVKERLAQLRGSGGVRIEDDVIIKANGAPELLSVVPRTVDEIEAFMAKARVELPESNPLLFPVHGCKENNHLH